MLRDYSLPYLRKYATRRVLTSLCSLGIKCVCNNTSMKNKHLRFLLVVKFRNCIYKSELPEVIIPIILSKGYDDKHFYDSKIALPCFILLSLKVVTYS